MVTSKFLTNFVWSASKEVWSLNYASKLEKYK